MLGAIMKLHCVSCNCLWGEGEFTESSGICPECFKEWINSKKRIKGMRECYARYGQYDDVDCQVCSLTLLCFKDTYGT